MTVPKRVPIVLFSALIAACDPARPAYHAEDPALRDAPVFLYPADPHVERRAFVAFFGNDVGFWKPHERLARRLAAQGFEVAGIDLKPLLHSLPDDSPASRDSAFARMISSLMARTRRALNADTLPAIIAGHSLGADIAVWTAGHAPPARLVGVLAMSPGARGHLRITISDLANTNEPTEAGSFSVPDEIARLPRNVRVAIVRGANDRHYGYADPALMAAGGERAQLFHVPLAGHSLKRIALAGPVVSRALTFLLAPRPAS